MSDTSAPTTFLCDIRARLTSVPLTLPLLFQTADVIAEHMAGDGGAAADVQRIAVVGATTIDYLQRAIACAVAQEGLLPVIYQAPYGAFVQEVLDPASDLHAFRPDLVVLAPHWRDLIAELPPDAAPESVAAALTRTVSLFQTLWQRLAERPARIIQHLPAPPPYALRGIADRLSPAAPANQVRQLNQALLEAGRGVVNWVDMEALAAAIGTRRFMPAKLFHTARLEHDPKFLPEYLPAFRGAWRAAMARTKKVLVLDLDNTLWGGVIGDDGADGGADGIMLGADSPTGEAFVAWQRYIKALGDRGVILAVCSKNDPAIAEAGLAHPHAVLKRSDFAAFVCSWDDKASGLRRIAAMLNVGLDSFVFCDDNPAECALIGQCLPEVATVCVGADPTAFIDLLESGHWFDTGSYTAEDMIRAAAYTARSAALAEQAAAPDIGAYLAGLGMKGRCAPPGEADIGRIAQLEQKTNQFNTTTRRYTEAQIRALLGHPDALVLAFRLSDRFGDHGLTATLIARRDGADLRIDSWLMSCRIFSRSAEQFILLTLLRHAAAMGVRRLLGEYRPTAKNAVVADLYPRLGFTALGDGWFAREVGAATADLRTYIEG